MPTARCKHMSRCYRKQLKNYKFQLSFKHPPKPLVHDNGQLGEVDQPIILKKGSRKVRRDTPEFV